jgi:hypothetical protein
MQPNDLDTLLGILRQHGVASAEVPTADGCTLRVVFEPRLGDGPLPGTPPTPGGWKGPDRLDAPQQYDEVP